MEKTFKQYCNSRWESLKKERSSWLDHYREISDNIQPRRGRYLLTDTNKGDKINQKIIDGTAGDAVRILRSGMMSGLTSPARPWFVLATPDPDMMEYGPVKEWLEIVEQRINMVFARSNLYNSLPTIYEELALFGTAPMAIEEDFDTVIRTQTFTAGEYCIGLNDKLEPNCFAREFRVTVLQTVSWFGLENVSPSTKTAYDNGNYDAWVDIYHLIDENDGRFDMGLQNKRPFREMYWEKAQNDDKFLQVRGYHEFPIVCPRWDVTSTDIYGRSPGMEALGDVKQLQAEQKRKLEGLDKWVRPPMKGPASLQKQKSSILPGDITYLDETQNGQTFSPVFQVNPDIAAITQDIGMVQERIRRAFYADLFLMMNNSDRRQITAREIDERHEEKLLMLGPVLERLNDELLRPLIDRTFNIMVRASQGAWRMGQPGLIPPPPPELENITLEVEYVSILAQAQKSVSTSGVDRLMGFVGSIAQLNPEALDKIDFDETVDKYSNMIGVPVSIVRTDDKVRDLRDQREQKRQEMEAIAMGAQAAESAKTLSQAQVAPDRNALEELAGM